MKLLFDTHGNERQKEVCRYWINPEIFDIVYGGSKGSGKSYLGCSLIFSDALTYPGTHYFIARRSLNDLRKYTVPSIYEVFQHWGLTSAYYNFNGQDNVFTLYNGSKVFLIDAKWMPSDPLYQRFGSMQMTRGWIEEAGEFDLDAKNNLAASIGRWKNDTYNLTGKLLQTCNPAKNYLYREYYKKAKDKNLERWKRFVQALPKDNKKLPAGYLENLNKIFTKAQKLRLLQGNWEYDDDPATMIEYDNILNIFTNDFIKPTGKRYITADVARFGKDNTIIRVWDGFVVLRRVKMEKSSIVDVAERIKALAKEYSVPRGNIVVDEDGIGGGVVDLIPGCKGFIANSKPVNLKKDESYKNLKSQCGFKLADKVNENEIYEQAEQDVRDLLVEDLEQIKQSHMDKEQPKSIISKETVKELIGRSPDDGDTYIMRMLFEVLPKGSTGAKSYD